jgi:hypothetical protein
MAELRPIERAEMSRKSGDMMTLLLLDDAWTEFVRGQVPPDVHAPFPLELIAEMNRLLAGMDQAAQLIRRVSERLGPDLNARFDALMWGDGLSTEDRDDLRWLVTRAGGVAEFVRSTADTLMTYGEEVDALDLQVRRVRSGEQAIGDLSPSFRCGLASGLLISGAASLPSAAGTGAAVAIAAGGAITAGVIVGATGGIGALALIVAGILVMRRQKC